MDGIGEDEDSNEKENKLDSDTETNGNNTRPEKIIRALKWGGTVLCVLLTAATLFWFNRPLTQSISDKSKQAGDPETTTKQQPVEKLEMLDFINRDRATSFPDSL